MAKEYSHNVFEVNISTINIKGKETIQIKYLIQKENNIKESIFNYDELSDEDKIVVNSFKSFIDNKYKE